ncbi:DoxX family protein [Labedella endophytica]|uniref:DoxX family protein n=1 Tax=Labedella endophytica TaxID=1523160 RepID=UPI001FB5FA42|nr:DoxX family membrane protein [Labedella endophytica]
MSARKKQSRSRSTKRISSGSRTRRTIGRIVLGSFLAFAGISHLTFARDEFTAQVPDFVPLSEDTTVLASGVVEITLGTALLFAKKKRTLVGWAVAAFFVAIFPGNISQFVNKVDAFGLTSDTARGVRLIFQPILVLWALWSTGAWHAFRTRR